MKVLLRETTDSDMELILAWRNNPLIWKGLYTQARENRPLTWEEHNSWWHSPYRTTWKIFIIQIIYPPIDDVRWNVGYLNVGQLDHWRPEIAIVVGDTALHGQGIGTEALKLGLQWIKEQGKLKCHTSILKDNLASIHLFEKVGFKRIGEAREGEWEYEIDLKEIV